MSPSNNIKITVVGDGVVGKTCLLISYTQNKFPEEYVPTVFENYTQTIVVDDITYNMTLWDSAGQEDYERLRILSYPKTNIFLICFSVDVNQASYHNVTNKWVPEIRHHMPNTPIILVATKTDLRNDPNIKCYTIHDGKKLKRKAKVDGYVECSAKNHEGLEDVFKESIRAYNNKKIKKKDYNCIIL